MSVGQFLGFKVVNVAAINRYLPERGVNVNGYLKPGLVKVAVAVGKMLAFDPNE